MTTRTALNNKNTRLMAMSGSSNNTAAVAQGSVKQMVGNGAPPPSEDEVIGSLPVGDGFNFMMLLVVLFGTFKVRRLIFE
jgi:hypothetical protein